MAKIGKAIKEKNWLRAILFLIVTALLFIYLNNVFGISENDGSKRIFNEFYQQKSDTLDVVCIGTSATNRYFIGPKAYNDEGIASINLATMGLPMLFVPNLIDEVEKTQEPQLYVIELRGVLKSKNDVTDAHIRRVTDSMTESVNKYAAVERALEYVDGATGELSNIDPGKLDYYVPIVKYHGRLLQGDMSLNEFFPYESDTTVKGYMLTPNTLNVKPQKTPVYSDDRAELAGEMCGALNDVLDKCDKLDKDVLFVLAPYSVREGQPQMFNTAIDMVTERGYPVLNFNQKEITDTMKLDWERDFYNSKHVNYVGAEKYTAYLTAYLKENYDLPDRRGDSKYDSWAEDYEKYLEFVSVGLEE